MGVSVKVKDLMLRVNEVVMLNSSVDVGVLECVPIVTSFDGDNVSVLLGV